MTVRMDSATAQNRRDFAKPNEDAVLLDREHGIAIVCDGVTQNHDEYTNDALISDAGQVAVLFAEALRDGLVKGLSMREAVFRANDAVRIKNISYTNAYPPALVFVCGRITEDRLEFSYVGDASMYLLRDEVRICLADIQTRRLGIEREKLNISKQEIYDHIANHIEHPLGYGVITGENSAMDFLSVSSFRLQRGDRMILASDGMEPYLSLSRTSDLQRLAPREMIELSDPFDRPPYAKYADDKTVAVVDIL